MVIASALPHLELLDWEDRIRVPCSFFTSLAQSPIQHLRLFRIQVDDKLDLELTSLLSKRGWPLRTLYVEPMPAFDHFDSSRNSITFIFSSILRACASTLENFAWIGTFLPRQDREAELPSNVAGDFSHLHFSRLNHLRIEGRLYLDRRILNALPGHHLRVLQTDQERDEITTRCSEIPSLEIFVWTLPRPLADLKFLECNTQLSKLDIPRATSPALLQERLLPLTIFFQVEVSTACVGRYIYPRLSP